MRNVIIITNLYKLQFLSIHGCSYCNKVSSAVQNSVLHCVGSQKVITFRQIIHSSLVIIIIKYYIVKKCVYMTWCSLQRVRTSVFFLFRIEYNIPYNPLHKILYNSFRVGVSCVSLFIILLISQWRKSKFYISGCRFLFSAMTYIAAAAAAGTTCIVFLMCAYNTSTAVL